MKESIEFEGKKPTETPETTVEKLRQIKAKEKAIKKEDPLYSSPWHVIDPEKLTPEVIELYEHFEKKEFRVAREELEVLREKIKQIKNAEKRGNNERFLKLIDDKIAAALLSQETEQSD